MTDLILFNPHAGNGTAGRETRNLSKMLLGDSLRNSGFFITCGTRARSRRRSGPGGNAQERTI